MKRLAAAAVTLALALGLPATALAGTADSTTSREVPPPVLYDVTVSPSTFYPYVVDGYRDDTTFAFRTDTTLRRVDLAVGTADGQVVRRERLATRYPGVVRWRWDGRTGGGHLLVPGRYEIVAVATTADGITFAITGGVTSATTVEKRRVRAVRPGARPSSSARTSGCRATPDDQDRLALVCRDAPGAQARVTYDFRLPTGVPGTAARGIRWRVEGRAGSGGTGQVRVAGRKVAEDRFRVEVRVVGERSYLVDSVTVAFTAYVGR